MKHSVDCRTSRYSSRAQNSLAVAGSYKIVMKSLEK